MPPQKIYKTALKHFNDLVEIQESGCWFLKVKPHHTGYAIFQHNGGHISAHVFAFENFKHSVTYPNEIHHKCEIKRCCNPEHLEELTCQENLLSSSNNLATINKNKTHCPQGHEYTKENTYINNNKRHCWICIRAARTKSAALRGFSNALKKIKY